ncbi:mannose-6-phosphate receptor binding domain-containing protein [Diplogelasinospora grovesii]|uniref:Mannose-6-phosphate receptor binding domain-containing protein n=1 Tax=Diplogelasinospora grovesii TaxID=303347 RepID=A0AAN6NAU6_9PEZI|nr:mannose-6-phosphate receptor binding domain-containing protein [Diplogelasinospora grovesii]
MMHPQSPRRLFLALLAAAGTTVRAAEAGDKTSTTATAAATPCVATSTSGAFYDLRPDVALPVPSDGSKKLHKGIPTEDYVARGWDYGSNFTLNICNSVVKPVDDVVGIDRKLWANVSAYYDHKGKVYSLGQQSSTFVPRGRKLVLQYTNGSPCGSSSDKDNKDKSKRGTVHDGAAYKYHDYDHDQDDDTTTTPVVVGKEKDDDDKKKDKDGGKRGGARRKSATISFLCDREPMNSVASASFIGTDPDECAYFFEIRSQHACAGAEPHKPGSVGPGSVFAIILAIAVLVYFVGGVFYQRTVAHARGWRQLPNYSMWSGMWSFVKDIFIILTSSCARFLPSRRGYRTLSISPTGRNGHGNGNSSSRNTGNNRDDSENRLIDQLDEEWDD